MFGGRKSQQPGKIRLPRLTAFPNYEVLKGLFDQAQINRGQDVELGWNLPGSLKSYSITIKFDKVTPNPQWQVWEDDGRQAKLVSKFETNDLNLILDVVMMLETQNTQSNTAVNRTIPPGGNDFGGGSLSGTAYPAVNQAQTIQEPRNQNPLKQTGQFMRSGTQYPSVQDRASGFSTNESFKGTSVSGMPEGSLPADFYSESTGAPGGSAAPKVMELEGDLSQVKITDVLTNIGMSKLTGLLEVVGDSNVAQIYVIDGAPKHAQSGATIGDDVVKELVTWRSGGYIFKPDKFTDMVSCERSLQASIMEGTALYEQLKQLQDSGLVYESVLVPKQKNLGDTELKLLLSKGHPLDFEWQKSMY